MCFGADAVSYLYDHLSTRILSLITAACAAIGHGPIALYAALIYKADVGASLVVIVCDHDLGSAPPSEPCCPLSAVRCPVPEDRPGSVVTSARRAGKVY